MCYQLVYIVFDFQTEAGLKDSAAVIGALTELIEGGYHLTEEGIESAASAWTLALRKGQRSVWVVLEDASHFAVTLSIVSSNWRRLYLSFDRAASAKPQHMGKLVQAGEVVFQALKPDYGYGLVSLDTQMLDAPGEGDYGISTVYDYNFYSPRLVAKLGEATLKVVSSTRTEVFSDGGMLLQLTPNPLGDRKPYTAQYQTAAEKLGAAKFQQGG